MSLRDARAQPDEALAGLSRAGDEQAFDVLVERYKDRLYGLAYRVLGNREDALEIAQDAFVRAHRALDTFRGEAAFGTWLYRIAMNLARNRLRDRTRKGRDKGASLEALAQERPGIAQALATAHGNPRADAAHDELQRALEQCLADLPEHYRIPFVLRTVEDLSYEEIAAILECPVGTVKSRLNAARKELRERLKAMALV